VAEKNTSRWKRSSELSNINEEEILKKKLGKHLKMIHWTNDDKQFKELTEKVNYITDIRIDQFKYTNTSFEKCRPPVYNRDQFTRLHHSGQLLKEYCKKTETSYDYVFRFRLDIWCQNEINITRLPKIRNGEIYTVMPKKHFFSREIFYVRMMTFCIFLPISHLNILNTHLLRDYTITVSPY
jgi:hypothetical protein